jgi:hypothetical protein
MSGPSATTPSGASRKSPRKGSDERSERDDAIGRIEEVAKEGIR